MEAGERDKVIRLLVLQAGALVEELEPQLPLTLPEDSQVRTVTIAKLVRLGADCAALLEAAEVLHRCREAQP